jgi:hypothetical protein
VLLSQSAPILEQDDDSEQDERDGEEVIGSQAPPHQRDQGSLSTPDANVGEPGQVGPTGRAQGSPSDKKGRLQSIQSLVDKKEQEFLLEQTFNRDLVGQLASDVFDNGEDEALPNPEAQRETLFCEFQVKGHQHQEEGNRDPIYSDHKLESHSQELRQTWNQDQDPVGTGE